MPLQIENAIDLHLHFSPDHLGGSAITNGIDCRTGTPLVTSMKQAVERGQAGAVLKSHSFASTAVASTLRDIYPDLKLFGGICTDYMTGGLNIDAVDAALVQGAKIVWLPTLNSVSDIENYNVTAHPGPGISVLGDDGKPNDAVRQIFELIREHDAILATGHTSAEEHYGVIKEFGRLGKVLVTHAGQPYSGPTLSIEQCVELADLGATIEFTALTCTDALGVPGQSPTYTAAYVAAIGADRCTLGTDYGFMNGIPDPVPGLANFLERMWKDGEVAEQDLVQMASRKPAELLGITV